MQIVMVYVLVDVKDVALLAMIIVRIAVQVDVTKHVLIIVRRIVDLVLMAVRTLAMEDNKAEGHVLIIVEEAVH